MKRMLAWALLALVACGGSGDPGATACAPLPSPAPTGSTAWRARVDEKALERYQSRYPETFAGIWLDDAKQKVVVAFTDDPQPHRRRLHRLVDEPDVVEVVRVRLSRRQLTERAERISRDEDALRRRGITLTSVGVDDRTSRVVVGVARPSTEDADYLCTIYGADMTIQREAPPSLTPTGPPSPR